VIFLFPQLKLALEGSIFDDIKIQEQTHVDLPKIKTQDFQHGAITPLATSRR
jgi:hypothetical protein